MFKKIFKAIFVISISFSLKSFYQIPLAWSKYYLSLETIHVLRNDIFRHFRPLLLLEVWLSGQGYRSRGFWQISEPYHNQGGIICPPHYYCPPPDFQIFLWSFTFQKILNKNKQGVPRRRIETRLSASYLLLRLINTVLNVRKNCHFLNPLTQSFS